MNCQKLFFTWAAITCCVSSLLAQQDAATKEWIKNQQESLANQMVMVRMIGILQNKELQAELEITDYQLDDLKNTAAEYQKDLVKFTAENQEMMLGLQERMRTGDREAAMADSQEFQSKMFEISDQAYGAVEDVLLPHQLTRIKQIARQETLKYQSGFGDEFGIVAGLSQELDLSPSEAKKLRETIVEVRKEYYEKVAKLKAETHKKILDSLPAEKREKIKELLGDRYDGDAERRKMFEHALKKSQDK